MQIEQVKAAHLTLTTYMNFASMHQIEGLERIIPNREGKEDTG